MAHKLLDAATATGASTSIKVVNAKEHTIQVTWEDGADVAPATEVTAITMALEGSLDNSTWHSLQAHVATAAEISADGFIFHVVDRPVQYVRLNITTLTDDGAGGTPTVTALYFDYDGSIRNG